ncbi:nuclear transport factor 2 family protein [Elizabethkingia anophelis]|nr:nuclear transport factor 2 family protein [Elizabethkingia anophelis]EJG2078507.1 nuclear transport factor 2 family protein [Elizabethkingia anophelis]EJG2111464.1 nuclear transport factor 2 family protein [Elizabethkingia anophelis]MCT3915409.1 nuclear transport factor 2 family protein [Elizabethkingia anophelis]MCT3979349.1 nuclear transport factor 2 family protein [Elizabethkingia anophelis]MCT4260683.1 nuclear transport factor 2 family protein [Elizabethkingia anophelis]
MDELKINTIIQELSNSLQIRDYDNFASYFTDNATFEIPFTVNGGTIINGKENIKKHFENVSQNPLTKLIEIESVYTKVYHCTDSQTVNVEYFTKGKSLSTSESFEIQSSIALIRFDEGGIVYYKDFPNTLGIAQKAGVLSQLAATWTR